MTSRHDEGSMAQRAHFVALRASLGEDLDPILEAMDRVDRAAFVPSEQQAFASEDRPLPIGHGQTTSQPTMIAIMLAELRLIGKERVLEVGAGSGYQTALLAELASEVIGVELIPSLAERASRVLAELGYKNARIELAAEDIGWSADGPYDAIIVSAASPRIPMALMQQLAPGGRLVIPVGSREGQDLMLAEKRPEGTTVTRKGACSFVPLLGKDAF